MSTRTIRIESTSTTGNAETRLTGINVTSPAVYEYELSGRIHSEGGADGIGGVVRQKGVISVDNDFHGSFPDQPVSEAIIPAELSGCRIWANVIDPGGSEPPGIAFNIQGKPEMAIQWNCEIRISEATF
jgi:hypothetical protein